ncbi:MAG TPA: type II toxin-antitoxin system prevent-host-death family antitoxin [Mycobacteriales bacterium]|jgi:prevent-host-death family protein|nr:type II toxin-antitoxin system prevent-host-death family antitoxin [Mycobacteriales bacterium]
MSSVGVRELRQRASELLRRVEAGESIEVTDRGRPVAVLAPLPVTDPIERLRSGGDLIEARASLGDLPAPLAVASEGDRPSSVLARLRDAER